MLVYGGSGSGKSAWAEKKLLKRAGERRHRGERPQAAPFRAAAQRDSGGTPAGRAVYLATMENAGEEAAARVKRHRAMRERHGAAAGLGFVTMEQPVDIGQAPVQPGDFVLLEDLGNLLANEIWSPAGAGERAGERILEGIGSLLERAPLLVVVSSDVFGDGGDYDEQTVRYIRWMGELHRQLAAMGGEVVEVVCGIGRPV